MELHNKLKSNPIWFMLPSLALVAAIGSVVAGYTPLGQMGQATWLPDPFWEGTWS